MGFQIGNAQSAIKQVDRLLSNAGVVPWDLFGSWVREVVVDDPQRRDRLLLLNAFDRHPSKASRRAESGSSVATL